MANDQKRLSATFLVIRLIVIDTAISTAWYPFQKKIQDTQNSQIHIHTYHSRFIPEGVAEVSQIFIRDTHVLPKLVSYEETADLIGGRPIAILLQSISDVSAINPLVAFYDIHGGKREVLLFYFVPDTTRDNN
jgi:hypothetical protein